MEQGSSLSHYDEPKNEIINYVVFALGLAPRDLSSDEIIDVLPDHARQSFYNLAFPRQYDEKTFITQKRTFLQRIINEAADYIRASSDQNYTLSEQGKIARINMLKETKFEDADQAEAYLQTIVNVTELIQS